MLICLYAWIIVYYVAFDFLLWLNSGLHGVLKKTIFAFWKLNFENSAICRIFKKRFCRTKKQQFMYTMYTTLSEYYFVLGYSSGLSEAVIQWLKVSA